MIPEAWRRKNTGANIVSVLNPWRRNAGVPGRAGASTTPVPCNRLIGWSSEKEFQSAAKPKAEAFQASVGMEALRIQVLTLVLERPF